MAFISFLNIQTWKDTEKYGPEKTPYLDAFHAVITSLIFIKILTIEEENNWELAFFDTLLKRNNGKMSIGISEVCTH